MFETMKHLRERSTLPLLVGLILVLTAQGFGWQAAARNPKQPPQNQQDDYQKTASQEPAKQQPKKPADAPPDQPRPDEHVIMISIDGLIPEYYTTPAQIGLRVPHLIEMRLNGAYADGVEGVYPS